MRILWIVMAAALLSSCASATRDAESMTAATTIDPFALGGASESGSSGYVIGATDLLKVSVFQVPDLSFDELRVDASGNIQMPLIGTMRAAGRTPGELSTDISRKLAERYLRNPQVSVSVSEAASQKVTVDGAVAKPGVYVMRGRTSLLQAVAMAEGPTQTADLRSVAVFRTVDDRRMVAVFDLAAIRNGQGEDPVLLGDDIVVVDTSRLNSTIRTVIETLPALAIFSYFR